MSYLKLYDWPAQEMGSKIWYRSFVKDERTTSIRTIPDLGVEFYLIYGGEIQVRTSRKTRNFKNSYIRGLVDGYGEFRATQDFVMIGVRCMPWIAKDLFRMPVSEIYNSRIDLKDINTDLSSLEPKSLNGIDIDQIAKRIQNTVLRRYDDPTKEESYVQGALRMILRSSGTAKIEWISRELNITSRHLRRLFKHELGCSPKEVCMRVKVRSAISFFADHQDVDMNSLARHTGFVDQSHFNRDFQSIVGLTPSHYFAAFERKSFI